MDEQIGTDTEDEDFEAVAEKAYARAEKEEKGEVEIPAGTDTQNKDSETEGQTDDKTDKPADSEAKNGKPAEGNDDKPADDADGVAADKKITEYAEKHKMTYAEAKEDIEKTEEIIKQFKNDPAEMARAMRNKDREYHKLRLETEKAAAKKEPAFQRMTDDQYISWAKKHIKENDETMVAKFRERFPAKSEAMSDEAIIEEIAVQSLPEYKEKASAKEAEIRSSAMKRRDEMISGLSEADRKFIPDVKALLQSVSDHDLITSDDLVKDALYMAKGRKYDADIKAAEERGYKRAIEKPQIIGVKNGGGQRPSGSAVGLNANQKAVAKEMFGADYDDDKSFDMFQRLYKDELKKNPNFDPYKG